MLPHDWELNIISSIHHGCYYLDIPLIDYRIHNNNTTGLENIINEDEMIKKRINTRNDFLKQQIDVSLFALTLDLNSNQKELCEKYNEYLSHRVYAMENKKVFSLIIYFIKGKYRQFGRVKTFLGDLMNIIK